jgi:4-amino-4-deoxy-L-arabinose transferase-like glycosyltransferase
MTTMRNVVARLSARPAVLILLAGLALNLSGTWLLPLIDRDEPRFAEASREMLARRAFVVPTFNGAPRYDKPPLIYWAQMAAYRVLGETPLAARLPSALFATGTAWLIFFWTRRLAPARTALAAALIFMTTVQMAIHARLAVADMPMIFFFAAACWSGWEMTRPEAPRRRGWWLMFYVSLALGFLAKGPIAWLPLAGLILGRWRHPQQFTLPPASLALGLLLTLGLVGLWGIPALLQTQGEFMREGLGRHVIYRSFGVMDGHGAGGVAGWILCSPMFLATFFFSFFPWALRVPRGLRLWWPHRRTDIIGWYLLAQAGLVFLVFSIVRTKLPHYTLPAFPCLAIWLAKLAGDGWLPGLKVGRQAMVMAVVVMGGTLALGLTLRASFVSHALFEKARPQLQPATRLANVQDTEPSLVWEFRQVITNHMENLKAADGITFILEQHPAVLVMPTAFYETNRLRWPGYLRVVQARGVNWARITPLELTALIHP